MTPTAFSSASSTSLASGLEATTRRTSMVRQVNAPPAPSAFTAVIMRCFER